MPGAQRGRTVVVSLLLSFFGSGLGACSGGGSSEPWRSAECAAPSDCAGADTDCRVRTCTAGVCGFSNVAAGTEVATQVPGDCRVVQCDGAGGTTSVADDADVPPATTACVTPGCTLGVPIPANAPAGTACSEGGGSMCDGDGACVACLVASDCGASTACAVPTCVAGACGVSYTPAAVVVDDVPGDCKTATTCDGAGGTVQSNDDTDVPVDGNACTDDVCTAGVPSNPNSVAGTACAQSGGTRCDGAGACVECLSGPDCTSLVCASGACQPPTCQDRVKNGDETDVDCGGTVCPKCGAAHACLVSADCASGKCLGYVCVAPAVAATSPASGAAAAPVSPAISVTFDVAMQPSSLLAQDADGTCAGTFQLSRDDFATCLATSGPPAMTAGDTKATWPLAAPLFYDTTYRARITTAAVSAGGEPIAAEYTWSFTTLLAPPPVGTVVVSQVYGGGGNVGSVWRNDFVELHNTTAAAVSVAGWSIQCTSSTGTTWSTTPLSGVIPAGGYYLVQESAGTGGTTALPTPDAVGVIAMGSTAGKVALVASTTPLTGCPTSGVLDLVGYGTTTTCSETRPAPAPSNTTAVLRAGSGCVDTGDNSSDFVVGAPGPRSSASAALVCSGAVNGTGVPQEADFCNVQFPASFSVVTGQPTPTVYGQVYEAGVTEAAGAAPSVVAQLGFGPAATNPITDGGWVFVSAGWNLQTGNDDEYQASFTAPAVGDWSYAYRFSLDGGATWTYCDVDGAGSGGFAFDATKLGVMTVTP